MKITSTDKKVTIEVNEEKNTYPLNYLGYQKTINGVSFLLGRSSLFTTNISQLTVNEVQATSENVDELLDPLFRSGNEGRVTLPIEIADVNELENKLSDKADLGEDGKILSTQLPSYVDQIIEGNLVSDSEFEVEGLVISPENNKIYVDLESNNTFRWSGSKYTEVSQSISLGETEQTAFAGDKGKSAYDHSQATGNPHKTTKSDIGISNVDNTSDLNKPVSTAQKKAIDDAINNIQIGGRNYLHDIFGKSYWTRLNTDSGTNIVENDILKLTSGTGSSGFIKNLNDYITDPSTIEGKDCILSFELKGDEDNLDFAMYITTTSMGLWNQKTSTLWKRFSFRIKYESEKNLALSFHFLTPGEKSYYVRNIKLETGNKATDWSPAPEDIQIGGTNLLLNSGFQSITGWRPEVIITSNRSETSPFNSSCKVLNWTGTGWYQLLKSYEGGVVERFLKNVTYTLSFYMKADSAITVSVGIENLSINKFSLTTEWQKFTYTFVGNGVASTIIFYGSGSGSKHLTQPKLERGNKATDWSPAPEDICARGIDTRNLLIRHNETKDQILLINGTTQIFTNHSMATEFIKVTSNENLTFHKKLLASSLADTYIRYAYYKEDKKTLVLRLANDATEFNDIVPAEASYLICSYPTNAEIKIERSLHFTGWSPAPEDIEHKIDNIEIGGTNLLLNTKDFSNHWEATSGTSLTSDYYRNFRIAKLSVVWLYYKQSFSFEKGETYTLSAYAKAETEKTGLYVSSPEMTQGYLSDNLSLDWKRYSWTFTAPKSATETIGLLIPGVQAGKIIYICGYKLERGNKATDWSPAPEDIENKIDDIEIGGRNLLSNSKKNETNNSYGFAWVYNIQLKKGTQYTFSANGRIDEQAQENGYALGVYMFDESWTFSKETSIKTLVDSTSYITFTSDADRTVSIGSYMHPSGGTRLGNVTLNWYKLEIGNKATDWSPAPEDIESKIDNIKVGGTNMILNSGFTNQNVSPWIERGNHSILVDTINNLRGHNTLKCTATGSGDPNGTTDSFYLLRSITTGTFIFSFFAKSEVNVDFKVRIDTIVKTFSLTTTWQRFSIDVPVDNSIVGWLTSATTMWFALPKLERGNKATDWSPAPEDMQAIVNYSTIEQFTGKRWIDGKKIYQKTITVPALPNTANLNIPHGIVNPSKFIKIEGIAHEPNGATIPLPHISSIVSDAISIYVTSSSINITTFGNRTSYTDNYVTLYYTCTDR